MAEQFSRLLAERAAFEQQIEAWPAALRSFAQTTADLLTLAGVAMIKMEALSPSSGYEPFFVEAGVSTILARGLAHLTTRYGRHIAQEAKRYREVAEAIRFLAKRRQKAATLRRAHTILRSWRETSVVESLLGKSDEMRAEFIGLLEALDRDGSTDYERLTDLAARLAPILSLSRGPKVSAASAAHAFLLKHDIPSPPPRRPHARHDRTARNQDALTEATQREFGSPNFDSRPAKRRSKRTGR